MKAIFILQIFTISSAFAATLNVGVDQTYTTIAAAYEASVDGDTIYVYPGIYEEKLQINKSSITLKGSAFPSTNPADNGALITFGTYASAVGSNDKSATLLVSGANFTMYNMNVTNSAGQVSQAVALSATGKNQGFYASAITGWQDTLYAHSGSQFYGRCYISGAVDFVFGTTGNSWYQGCTMGVLRNKSVMTAQGRSASNTTGYFVFDKAKVIVGPGGDPAASGTSFLGRPWKDFSRTVFQNSNLNNIVISDGWQPFTPTQDLTNVLAAEYANTNAGTGTGRVTWSQNMTSAVDISTILSNYESWVDAGYLGLDAN